MKITKNLVKTIYQYMHTPQDTFDYSLSYGEKIWGSTGDSHISSIQQLCSKTPFLPLFPNIIKNNNKQSVNSHVYLQYSSNKSIYYREKTTTYNPNTKSFKIYGTFMSLKSLQVRIQFKCIVHATLKFNECNACGYKYAKLPQHYLHPRKLTF